jgi:uncharacterized protein (DUF1015 family)
MEVSPFRGIRYNQGVVADLAQVICPPYDVISPKQQRLYYEDSDYNAIRLEFPEPAGDKYQVAAVTFHQWLRQGILQIDRVSSFYLHDHHFEYLGKRMVRRGLIARVRLEPWGNGIYPHEETSSKAKSDRLQLMRTCRANFSPLFSLYQDSEQKKVAAALRHVSQEKPLVSVPVRWRSFSGTGEAHRLWGVTDREIKRELCGLLSAHPIYVADGHHRYETALDYQQEMRKEQSAIQNGAFNHVMMELVEFSDPGLVVLPLHRLVRGVESPVLTGLADRLRRFFVLESVPFEASGSRALRLPADSCLGILGLQPGALVVLKRRQDVSLEAMLPANRSQVYREFGVSILNHVVFDGVLSGAKEIEVTYAVDMEEAHQQIREAKYQLAFVLHPARPAMVKAIADARDRMPRKSTYFYPKVPAGLVINPLD